MFIRFVIPNIDEDSHQPQGLFQKAYELLKTADLNDGEEEQLQSVMDWFQKHLPDPRHLYVEGRAIFWYKTSAQECIKKMWELTNLLRSYGYTVEVKTCRQLGNVRYSDDYQVAGYPSKSDGEIITKMT